MSSYRNLSFLLLVLLLVVQALGTWVDPDTPKEGQTTTSLSVSDKREYQLVFSDEFEQEGRTFHDGSDPRWTALNKNDYTNAALHFYSHDNANTSDGKLKITTEKKVNAYRAFNETSKKFFMDKKHVQSAMVQSWNKFCFTGGIIEFRAKLPGNAHTGGLWPAMWMLVLFQGGIIEFRAKLPGNAHTGGLWPAMWMLGNLARATYVGSSDYMWPYSYNQCDPKKRGAQEINACSKASHYGMEPGFGRGAPEIDVIEAMQGEVEKLPNTNITRPYQSCSLQVAPGIEHNRPELGHRPKNGNWYTGMEYNNENGTRSELNPFFYGVTLEHELKRQTYQADALSANTGLNVTHYKDQHLYRVEWEPPEEDGSGGRILWYTDEEFVYSVKGADLGITGSEIPSEAMYLLMNTAVASSWGFPAPCPDGCSCECFECGNPDCACALPPGYCDNFPVLGFPSPLPDGCKCECFECGNPDCACALPPGYCDNFPATFEIDYVRVYQAVNESKHTLGCSPVTRPTELFIKGHARRYMEKGDKVPLQDVVSGGAYCSDGNACEGFSTCKDGVCVCNDGYTGPTCLAYDGFYVNESRAITTVPIGWSKIWIPNGMVVLILVLVAGFAFAMVLAVKSKKSRHMYKRVENADAFENDGNQSYQHAESPTPKVVTYSVIDGRLVDK
eukprot:CAMPEP_0113657558 /NCGR_PEP_ID=MMETSP0017_2-20120614/31123_1 /TAXON_ID=2856 /ORGANISM="Cylindrotheca closterium" /LENGTH=671 /DNA_ID=CAMNT_0000571519 /DNA_START=167 /DNA_END=2184 /DNA_ORIENTATION=- /assembly_acc=CAM_ASM_000147